MRTRALLVVLLLPTLIADELPSTLKLSKTCAEHFTYYLKQVRRGRLWALKMLDSSVKTPDGIMFGHWKHLGNFDECVDISVSAKYTFRGKYCLARLSGIEDNNGTNPIIPISSGAPLLDLAMCVPSTCSASDVVQIIEWITGNFPPPLQPIEISIQLSESECYLKGEGKTLEVGFWCFLSFEIFIFALALTITLYNWWPRKEMEMCSQPTFWHDLKGARAVLSAFDIRDNLTETFQSTRTKDSIPCLDGLRAITMLWVLMGHRLTDDINGVTSNFVQATEVYQKALAMPFVNAYFAVDSFFLLSGCLTYLTCARMMENQTFSLLRFYAYRYLRLSVPYVIVILFYIFVLPLLGSGPRWDGEVIKSSQSCRDDWWMALLYIQNYADFGRGCITQTWYLSADMQLSFLAPLLIVPLNFSTVAGHQLLALSLLTSCFIPFGIAYANNLFWTYHGTEFFSNILYTEIMYMPTHTRASPYIFGLLLGHILFKAKGKQMPQLADHRKVAIGWVLSTILCISTVYTLSLAYQPWFDVNKLNSAFYNGFSHVGWAMGVSWIILACSQGKGGPVNRILSWTGWLPLSRLSYCAYLVQFIWLKMYSGSVKSPLYFSFYSGMADVIGDLLPVLFLATFLHLTVELPVVKLLRRAFRYPHLQTRQRNTTPSGQRIRSSK